MRLFLLILAAFGLAAPATAQQRAAMGQPRAPAVRGGGGEQDAAYRAMSQGQILPLPQIRARINVPGATYIGTEFDGRIYRLKFMRGAEVIWIDVDARTGRVIGRQ